MIPNIITLMRLILVPVIIVTIGQGNWILAFVCFSLAGVSDAVDGTIARRYSMQTELGAYLDPIADKALLVSIFVMLSIVGLVPSWVAIMVVSRDVMIVGGILLAWLLGSPLPISPNLISKLNTLIQISFAGLVLAMQAFSLPVDGFLDYGIIVVAALTSISMATYLA
ncbi:MAG: CDP-alcohol phosphatidyltransferase family protein, partial [Dolichospermum sp.]